MRLQIIRQAKKGSACSPSTGMAGAASRGDAAPGGGGTGTVWGGADGEGGLVPRWGATAAGRADRRRGLEEGDGKGMAVT